MSGAALTLSLLAVFAFVIAFAAIDAWHAVHARRRATEQARRHLGLRPGARVRGADVQRDGTVLGDDEASS